ncbi:extracellular solute-binding protein [Paenibacillus agricola]|uniref:ABC transporter substrate-binding protein n=1 Tax=Paenibacillus agricola TaxID=2716264 RepID=A0ABX0IYX8_9BACL|nr:extracellular solute-binding protein [Paenibacillus agricola]NHN28913.1 ABC transporter substrate-binding protein [Paenibacillus agricola]
MKSTRKWTAGVSCMVALSVLAGCAGNEAQPTTTPGAAGTGASGKPLEIKFFAGLYNEVPDMNNAFWTEWQKRTNTKLDMEWIPDGDLNTKLDLLLASADLPEVLAAPSAVRPTLLNAVRSGAFWDLTPFLGDMSQYPNLKNNLGKDALKYLTVDGKIYAVPRSRSRIDPGIKIRKDWLDKLNIPVPTTLDEYAAALKKIVEGDPDGNGKKDTLGLIGNEIIVKDADPSFAAGFGALDPTFDAEGGMIESRLTPQYADAVLFYKKLYDDGILSKEFAVMKKSQAEELYKTGRAASYGRSVWWDNEWETAIKKVQPEGKILNLHLKGPKGDAIELQTGVSGGYYISKKVPEAKVKELLKYFDQTASTELTDLGYYGIEGVHHTVVDGQKVLNDLGIKEVNTTSKGAGVLAYSKWGKVESASGSKAYNDAKKKEVEIFDEVGKVNPFNYTLSNTWNSTWPKYENEWKANVTKAIVGQITIDEYKAYVEKINNTPEMKKAYKEFAESYKAFNAK